MIEVDDYEATHSTKSEIKFINELGTHAIKLGNRTMAKYSRPELLAGYVKACFNRIRWGDIDPLIVTTHATMELKKSIPEAEGPANG